MPLRICHLDTERSWRGGEQQLLYLAKGLRAGGDLNVIACRRSSALADRARSEGLELLPVRPWMEWAPLSALGLRRALIRKGIQILHAHTAHAAALGALATLRTGIPLIVSRRVDFHLSKNPFTRWKYRCAAKILAVSAAIRGVLIEDGIPAGKIAVVRSGIDLARITADTGRREELGLPSSGPIVGQIAALAPHKDPFNFLRAMVLLKQRYRDVHGVMVGSGPLQEDVKREITRLDLGKTVLLMGFREDAPRLLHHFDVFVLSSYLEGLGTSILDAMAAGIPVVATRTGGIPEMVEDHVSGLLAPPRDPHALAHAIGEALADIELRGVLKKGGLRTVERFKAASMVEATRSVYEDVMRESSR